MFSLRARRKHPTPIASLHEGHSIIEEEYDEFWEEVKKQHHERSKEDTLTELVHLAAMCQRTAEDLKLI